MLHFVGMQQYDSIPYHRLSCLKTIPSKVVQHIPPGSTIPRGWVVRTVVTYNSVLTSIFFTGSTGPIEKIKGGHEGEIMLKAGHNF